MPLFNFRQKVLEDPRAMQNFEQLAVQLGDNWHVVGAPNEPPFLNGWVNVGASPTQQARFMKMAGFTILAGVISNPGAGSGTRAFELPVGYRPIPQWVDMAAGAGWRQPVWSSGGASIIDVYANVPAAPANAGAVVPISGPGCNVSAACFLDPVMFPHE